MQELRFKTNVKCGGCKAAVTPYLDNEPSIKIWRIDIYDPDRVMTIEGDELSAELIIGLMQQAGYMAEVISGS